MATRKNTQWVLVQRPKPEETLSEKHFNKVEADIPALQDGEYLVKALYFSIDPTYKGWATQDSYLPASPLNQVFRAQGLYQVVESKCEDFAVGDYVGGLIGLQTFAVLKKDTPFTNKLNKGLVDGLTPEKYLPVFAITGLPTAYVGLIGTGKDAIKEGKTLVVSGAAGNVGQWVVQLGKLNKMKVIGIAGTDEKCQYLKETLGADATVNYRSGSVADQLKKVAPDGIDVYFDNVGGAISDAVVSQTNVGGVMIICGLIANYNNGQEWGVNASIVLTQRIRVQGFIVGDDPKLIGDCFMNYAKPVLEGKFKFRYQTVEGFENVFNAMDLLWNGKKKGKVQVKV